MKGKNVFTEAEIALLRKLIIKRCNAFRSEQKQIRDEMRAIGFYGRDDFHITDMTIEKFDKLIESKKIRILKGEIVKEKNDDTTLMQTQVASRLKESLPPLIDENSEILILGTMPGEESLQKGEYYASSRNSFWKIIACLFHGNKGFNDYKEKEECLKEHHIALWDVLSSCEREGSSDANITNEDLNDIENLLKQYPNIHLIVCNGKEAFSYIENMKLEIDSVAAESTSNTNAKTLEKKVENWKSILKYRDTEEQKSIGKE